MDTKTDATGIAEHTSPGGGVSAAAGNAPRPKPRALGRGLESLLPSAPRKNPPTDSSQTPASAATAQPAAAEPPPSRILPVALIDLNPRQTRRKVDAESFADLKRSIENDGNLLSKTPLPGFTGESMSMTANVNNQLSGLSYGTAGATTVDNIGNNYTYNSEGQTTQVNNGSYVTTYTYDGNGQRVEKYSTMASKLYWYGPDGTILNESDTAGNVTDRYGWFNGEMVGRLDSSGPLHFMYHDHLGSTRLVVSSTGQVQDDLDYYPFGTAIPKQWTSQNMYQFTGYETDTESNTEHAWFRNHSPSLGRFMRPDPDMGSYDPSDPQSLNRYNYVTNRPLLFTDPYGLSCVTGDDGSMGDDGDGLGCAAAGINPDGSEVGGTGYAAYDVDGGDDSDCCVSLATAITNTGAWQIGTVKGVATFYFASALAGAATTPTTTTYVLGFALTNGATVDSLATGLINAAGPGMPMLINPELALTVANFFSNVKF